MSVEENKAIVRSIVERAWNQGDLTVIDERVTQRYVGHAGDQTVEGRAHWKRQVIAFRHAFPDLVTTVEDQIAEGDTVVTRWSARGTHEGEFQGIPPTGRSVTMTGINIDRIVSGQLIERWATFDRLGMMQQLGVLPMPGDG